jgi:hypothetical protein
VQKLVLQLFIAAFVLLAGIGSGPADAVPYQTVTPAAENLQDDEYISVFVFVDRVERGGCDTFFKNGLDLPLSDARITFTLPDGQRIERVTDHTGWLSFPSVDLLPGDEAWIEVVYPSQYRNAVLAPCPNSPTQKRITSDDFNALRSLQVVFRAWPTRVTSEPTDGPTNTPTPTSTPVETFTPTVTVTPSPTATVCPTSLVGQVWHDINANGRQDSGEPPLEYAMVTLWAGDMALQSLVTGQDGRYRFPDLVPGLYRIWETDPPDYQSTTAGGVEIQAGCGVTTQDFGDRLATECPRGIGGVVWNDLDADGTIDIGEPPLPQAQLILRGSNGTVVAKRITKSDGIYLFEGLDADIYTLTEINPPGYPYSSTLNPWIIELLTCRSVNHNFGNRSDPVFTGCDDKCLNCTCK